MSVNRGKQFEDIVQKAIEEVEDTVVVRLHDQTTGYAGSKNPCDFVVFHSPLFYAIECKSVHGNTLSIFSNPKPDKNGVMHGFYGNITDYQWESLLEMSNTNNVIAGILCWWVDKDITLFIPIKTLNIWRTQTSVKSVRFDIYQKDLDVVVIHGTKKRVFFEYDMRRFFKDMEARKS